MALASVESQRRSGGSGGLRRGRDTREVAFDGALGTVAITKEGELSPLAKLTLDDVSRTPLCRTCPRGPCGAGGLLDLPRRLLPASRAACAASAGRAGVAVFFFFNSQPLTTIPSFSNWRRPRRLASCPTRSKLILKHLAPVPNCCRLPLSSPPEILSNKYEGNERFAECRRQCARVTSALQSSSSEFRVGFGIRVALSFE